MRSSCLGRSKDLRNLFAKKSKQSELRESSRSMQKRVATSHGLENILIVEVIDVEVDDATLLGEEDFTPLKFFSRSEDNDLDNEVDYDSDSQKGISVGSPFSLQLAFSSPLSLHKDLSACMALLRNSPREE